MPAKASDISSLMMSYPLTPLILSMVYQLRKKRSSGLPSFLYKSTGRSNTANKSEPTARFCLLCWIIFAGNPAKKHV
jgi:hypothetical protein